MTSVLLRPCSISAACAFVSLYHRHHPRTSEHLFAVAAVRPDDPDQVLGVAIVGRPSARVSDDGWTAEVVRVATHSRARHRNPSSALYGACRAATRALGYREVRTYSLPTESGASLRAAGFVRDGVTRGGTRNRPSRPREDHGPTVAKVRWVVRFMRAREAPDALKKTITAPMNLALAKVRELFKPAELAFESLEVKLKRTIGDYHLRAEAANRAAAAEVQAAIVAGEDTSAAIAKIANIAATPGVRVRLEWTYEITNADAVPRELCSPDPSKIRAFVAANVADFPEAIEGAEGFELDGIRFSVRAAVSSRSS